jgi:NTP pyrophosphatase (non-canonical NTP hydrolase)
MELNDYQTAAARTARSFQNETIGQLVSALGLGGESAELAGTVLENLMGAVQMVGQAGTVTEILKKIHGHGHPTDRAKLVKELGDALWYVSDTARRHGIELNEVAAENIRKLTGRYPDGFAVERSVNRSED